MPEANIQISDELAVRGTKNALKLRTLKELIVENGLTLIVVFVTVSAVDFYWDERYLIPKHLLFLTILWLATLVLGYRQWIQRVEQMKGWSFYAEVDDDGVITSRSAEDRIEWNSYVCYKEFDDYLEIERSEGTYSFLPKTPDLYDVIEFTKRKISAK